MTIKLDWVLRDELAIGSVPNSLDDINELKKNKIVGILSLCSKEENPSEINFESYFICKRVVLPDHKYKSPPTIEKLELALETLESIISFGPIYIHCFAGVERSPLVCMAWLIKKYNLNPTQALDYMMDIHAGTNPLPDQLKLLHLIK